MRAARTTVGAAVVVIVALGARGAAAAPCVVRGTDVSMDRVTVHPPGDDPFEVSLHGVTLEATLRADGTPVADLHVTDDLDFHAVGRDRWYAVGAAMTVGHGMVRLRAGAWLSDVRRRGDRVTANVVLDEGDWTEGETDEIAESLARVEVPCAALTLSPAQDDHELPSDGPWWQSRGEVLTLHARPSRAAPSVRIAIPGCAACIEVRLIEARGAWLLVERVRPTAIVRGWVERSAVKRLPPDEGGGWSSGCVGKHPAVRHIGHGYATPPPGFYDGRATIRAGTPVYAGEASAGPWATFARDAEVKVHHAPSWSSTTVTRLPGVTGDFSASVPSSSVVLPPSP